MFEGVLKALGTSHAQRFVKVHFAVLQRLLEKPRKDKEKRMQLSAEFEEYLERIAREIREKAMAAGLPEDFAKWYAEEYRKRYAEEYLKGYEEGYLKGYEEGYLKGYEEGLVLGRNEVKTWIAAT